MAEQSQLLFLSESALAIADSIFFSCLRQCAEIISMEVSNFMGFLNRLSDATAQRSDIPEVTTEEECRALFQCERAVIFKHSEACDLSQDAYQVVADFLAEHPQAEIAMISVLDSRPLSFLVEQQTGVRHESPQILAMRMGKVVAHTSHRSITRSFLETVCSS